MGSKLIVLPGNDRIQTDNTIAEEQLSFVLSVLLASGVSEQKIESCLTNGELSTVKNKIAFRKFCEKEQISIVDDTQGGLKIYVQAGDQEVLMGEWFRPSLTSRIRSRKLFTEIHLTWWMFEEKNG